MSGKEQSFVDRLQRIDPRVIYGLLIVVLVAPLLRPLGFPIEITPVVQKFHATIETLKPGDVVFYAFEFGAGDYPEAEGAGIAVKRHLFAKGVRIVFATTNDQAVLVLQKSLQSAGIPSDRKYGVDWVFLGYIPGAETAIAALAADMHTAAKKDHYGTPVEQLPLMKEVRSVKDIELLIVEGGGTETPTQFVRQWYAPYKARYLQICISVVGPTLQPFVGAGQIIAMVVGASGGAQYELLIRRPGIAVAGMDAQAFGHVLVILFIVIGNVAYLASKRMRK
jgi:hypothetical protein